MTYSLHLSVDLNRLTEESRHLAKIFNLGTVHRAKPPSLSIRRDKPQRGSIAFGLKVPDGLAGKHAEYGTSVFAAGRGGLELVRTQLAQAGIEREELDQLTTADVSIGQAAATYIFKFMGKRQTMTFAAALHHHALLLGLAIKYDRQANTVTYKGSVTPDSPDALDVVLTVLRQPDRRMIRIAVALDSNYLVAHGWTSLESWRSAYAEARYAAIFNKNVRCLFQLDSPSLPFAEPSREVLEKLTPITEGLLREYFAGRDPLWYARHAVANSEAKRKRLVKGYRDVILGITGIDIVFPWQQFRWMAPAFLKSKLIYPGDLVPTGSQVSVSFCGATWPQLLATLRKKYRAVLLTHTSR